MDIDLQIDLDLYFYLERTFGSSWSFTTLAARAIGWSEPAACKQKSEKEQILGKLSIPFPAAVLVNYDQPVVGRKDDD